MPRPLSAAAAQAIFAQETGAVFLQLLTISHPNLSPTLRFVDANPSGVTSRGNVFQFWPFVIPLPGEFDDQLPVVQIRIDNIDRKIMEGVRLLTTPPACILEAVLASSPDTLEAGPFDFTLKAIDFDALVIMGTLSFEDTLNEPYPQYTFTPQYFPALFA